jgi:hypothetical protein
VNTTNTTRTTRTTTATTDDRLAALAAVVDQAYLNHWIRRQSGENAAKVADLALRGKRLPSYCSFCGFRCREHEWCLHNLTKPSSYNACEAAMTAVQLRTAKHIARAFGHLWANFDCGAEWADHHNAGREDGFNSSAHPLPTAADVTASGRYSWEVTPDGVVEFEINRPQGTAARVIGTLTSFKVEITKLSLDRHLICLFQQLQQVFGLAPDDAIERIETARGFALMGIRGGELHKVVMTA